MMQRHRCTRSLKEGSSVRCFRTDVNHPIADTWVCGPMRNQTPVHEPALVSALLTDNHLNVGGSLGGDVKAGRVLWQNAVKVPANPDVTELKSSCESSTHGGSTLAPIRQRLSFSPLFRCSVYRPPCHESSRILLTLRRPKGTPREAICSFSSLPPAYHRQPGRKNRRLEKLNHRVGQVHSANTTVKFGLLLINPFFAQL